MEKICTPVKMTKFNLDSLSFEIILSEKGNGFRARVSSMAQIPNIKDPRPEATSSKSYNDAIQKLIPKIENSLCGTDKKLDKVFQASDGKMMVSLENIVYETPALSPTTPNNSTINASTFVEAFKTFFGPVDVNNISFPTDISNQIATTQLQNINEESIKSTTEVENFKKFQDVIVEWQRYLLGRTKKAYADKDYFSPTTLDSYSRNLRSFVFPYLTDHPECDSIYLFTEDHIDIILDNIKCEDTKRVLLVSLRLIFDFAVEKKYISTNPIADKKIESSTNKKKQQKENDEGDYDFIEEEDRAKWINCMLKAMTVKRQKKTDAPLSYLFALLHGPRPEETCGVRWIDLDFEENDYHVQNAYKKIPIYDEVTMERIGWKKTDVPLKSPESYRHIGLDALVKPLLIEHKKEQQEEFKAAGKKWSEKEYVFLNSKREPFTPDILSKNFNKFIKANPELSHIVLYGLRHSFATHCRNCDMKADILALLMGHTEYETTQRYYIHISPKQKKNELQKVQQQDIKKLSRK